MLMRIYLGADAPSCSKAARPRMRITRDEVIVILVESDLSQVLKTPGVFFLFYRRTKNSSNGVCDYPRACSERDERTDTFFLGRQRPGSGKKTPFIASAKC